ncbi:PQQ-dependent sugar dehydrogenase [Sporosarcina sp. 179-K 3D1 HS]|uniref:PQQ-dependent sugar dehydrogenase n=1 Tax=Sporosarcina sp. 179-K 3D1 HS TaxID=3232169 RepID=UPI0039A1675A
MKRFVLLVLLLLLSGCSEQTQSVGGPPPFATLATGLDAPWSISTDGERFFISERTGNIVRVDPDGRAVRESVTLSQPLSTAAEAGLMGFVLRPDFRTSRSAYAYYTYDSDGIPVNRIVTLSYNGSTWREQDILLDGIRSGQVHHGGRLALSPDGTLYATIGDGARPESAQDPNSWNGKIIALQENGSFRVISSGHRNPQGLAWDEDRTLFASEHGQTANDEINKIVPGTNYGWPIVQGRETRIGMEPPLLTSDPSETWAPSGMAFHKGLLYVAALRGQAVLVIDPAQAEVVDRIEGFGRVRDVFSDGQSLYFITNNTDGRGSPSRDDDRLIQFGT